MHSKYLQIVGYLVFLKEKTTVAHCTVLTSEKITRNRSVTITIIKPLIHRKHFGTVQGRYDTGVLRLIAEGRGSARMVLRESKQEVLVIFLH